MTEDGEPERPEEFSRLGFTISSVTCSIACSRSIRLSRERSGFSSGVVVPRIRSSVVVVFGGGDGLLVVGMVLVKGFVPVPRSPRSLSRFRVLVRWNAPDSDGSSVEGKRFVGIFRSINARYASLDFRFFTEFPGLRFEFV